MNIEEGLTRKQESDLFWNIVFFTLFIITVRFGASNFGSFFLGVTLSLLIGFMWGTYE